MSDERKVPEGRGPGGDPPKRRTLPVLETVDRRHALKIMAVVAAAPALGSCAPGEGGGDAAPGAGATSASGQPASNPKAAGTPWDPDLLNPTVPWERTLGTDELETLASLCDVIIPADERSPSASAVGAHDFIDEWVSAPYDGNRADQVLVRGGLLWLNREAARRFGEGRRFRDLMADEQHAICDDIRYREEAAPELEAQARFFDKVRDLTSTAFWTTEEGMQDLGYVGNVPLPRWDPPPEAVLRHLGLA